MASDLARIQVRQNEVLLFKNGQPILRVERGTTLSVVKLLYQADPRNKGTVIGLKPETDDPLPCVVTLDQSPLEEAKYELITHEPPSQSSTGPASKEVADARQLHDGNSSNMPRLSHSKSPGHPRQQTSLPLPQMGQSASHTTPLTVTISPESNAKSLPHQEETTSSSLLLARRDNNYYPSHSSIFASSRRKKTTARKSVLPRKVSPTSSPNHSLNSKSIRRMHFQREDVNNSTEFASGDKRARFSESARCTETVDSPGLCDSTENGNPRVPLEETEQMDLTAAHHRENCRSSNATAPFSVEDSVGFSNFPTLESSSTNGSSPAVSDDHPIIIDIHSDSRETSGGENDSDSNFVSSENSPSHNRPTMVQRSLGNSKESLHIAEEETQCSHTSPPIVVLQNTVQVKTEPTEVLQTTNNLLPEQNNKKRSSHSYDDPENGSTVRSGLHTESYSVVIPTSSQDAHPSSLPVHQVSSLMPCIDAMGASPDHNESTESSHLHSGDNYMDGKEHSCDICHKQFDSANSVMRHKRSHSGDRPYICKICGWGFNLSGNLNQHLAIHQKVKPFKCVYCGKTFARSNVLKAHVRCHTGERPYQCQLCGSKFIIGHNLKKHMLTRHGIKEDDKIFSQSDGPEERGTQHGDQSENMSVPMSQP